jgi:hypothetical protein
MFAGVLTSEGHYNGKRPGRGKAARFGRLPGGR